MRPPRPGRGADRLSAWVSDRRLRAHYGVVARGPAPGATNEKGHDVPRALITGITGQDGLYLAELLTRKGYEVFGLVRGQSNPKVATVEKIIPGVQLLEGDLTDLPSLIGAMEIAQPDEVYN